MVHCCGPGDSMHACHAAGLGSIPGQDKFAGWGFFGGFSSPVRQMSGSFRPLRSPNIIWPSLLSSFITGANDLRCWSALKPQIYIQTICRWTIYIFLIFFFYYGLDAKRLKFEAPPGELGPRHLTTGWMAMVQSQVLEGCRFFFTPSCPDWSGGSLSLL